MAKISCLSLSLKRPSPSSHQHSSIQRTSISVNIKERLDFSCAVFDSSGGLVANAPHLPVHLGAMQEAVRYIHMYARVAKTKKKAKKK